MKKTLSINISGILFHIEEDGYDTLKNYLESINTHFSGYSDSKEIISDIENRIAEIFLSYLKNNNQVITAENVARLIEKMGTIADFSALEEKQEANEEEAPAADDFYKYVTPPSSATGGYKKLMRLESKKILGGVCAGIAHYFAIDVLWIRLIAILLLFTGNINFDLFDFNPFGWVQVNFGFGAIAVVAYIVLWVILPVSYTQEEDKEVKKLFRNPDDKVLGGVASGLSAYFGVKELYTRLAFVLLTFAGGSGIVIYLILWIITPVASSITERIKMKGGKITLDSIDSTLKETINPIPPAPETPFESNIKKAAMAVLTPFRVLGQVIEALGSALGSLGRFLLTLLRVFFGLIIFIFGIVLVGAPLVAFSLYLGIIDPIYYGTVDAFPLEMVTELVPTGLAASGLGLLAIPGIVILMLGLSVLSKKNLVGSKFGLVALALWLMCIATLGFQIPRVIAKFKEEDRVITNTPLTPGQGVLFLKVEEGEGVEFYQHVVLELKGTEDSILTLNQEYFSRGQSKKQAQENIKKITYSYAVKDSVITFERGFDMKSLGAFRDQKLNLSLAIPYNKPFIIDDSLLEILENTIYRNGYEGEDVRPEAIWVFNEAGLTCITCPEIKGERRDWDSFESEKAQLDSITKVQKDSLSKAKLKDAYFLKEN
jgi:phage shock protein PspC (stress-responsive transcriptional regulator)